MAKEEKLFSVVCTLNDNDFEDVYRIHKEADQKNHNYSMIVGIAVAVLCIVVAILLKNLMFYFYAAASVLIGLSYRFVPLNRKFLATNRLQYGDKREMIFYPHEVSVFEVLDDEEISASEREDATTYFSTGSMKAFENKNGFVFADNSIENGFLYVPKRGLEDETIAQLIDFAKNRCSSGYTLLTSILGKDEEMAGGENAEKASVNDDLDRYYGKDKLRLYDENGNRVRDDEEEAEDAETETEDTADESASETEA